MPAGASTSLVLDAELVAVDRDNNNRLKAFQELSTRARGAITTAEVRHVAVSHVDSRWCCLVDTHQCPPSEAIGFPAVPDHPLILLELQNT